MEIIYILLRILPIWSLPLAYILGELAISLRRRGKTLAFFTIGFVIFADICLCVVYFLYEGWITFPEEVRKMVELLSDYAVQ